MGFWFALFESSHKAKMNFLPTTEIPYSPVIREFVKLKWTSCKACKGVDLQINTGVNKFHPTPLIKVIWEPWTTPAMVSVSGSVGLWVCNVCANTGATVSNMHVLLDKLPVAQCQFLTFVFPSCLSLKINLSLFDRGYCVRWEDSATRCGRCQSFLLFSPPGRKQQAVPTWYHSSLNVCKTQPKSKCSNLLEQPVMPPVIGGGSWVNILMPKSLCPLGCWRVIEKSSSP